MGEGISLPDLGEIAYSENWLMNSLDLITNLDKPAGVHLRLSEFGLDIRWYENLLKWKGEGFKNQVAEPYVECDVILVNMCAWGEGEGLAGCAPRC